MIEEDKNIEVVPGSVDDLDISPVYDHLEIEKPSEKKNPKHTIVIPEEKEKKQS